MSFVKISFPQHDILKSQNHLQLSRYLGIFGCSLALFTRPGRAHAVPRKSHHAAAPGSRGELCRDLPTAALSQGCGGYPESTSRGGAAVHGRVPCRDVGDVGGWGEDIELGMGMKMSK